MGPDSKINIPIIRCGQLQVPILEMLSKRPHPVIGRLSELLVSCNRAGFPEAVATSPRSPLDYKIQSPRGLKNYDLGGVGLGIVAALDKCGGEHEILGKYSIFGPNSSLPVSVPVSSSKNCERWNKGRFELEMEVESLENYAYVTCHGPNNQSYTKVYYDGCEYGRNSGVISMPKQFQTKPRRVNEDVSAYPTSDFLSCHLCRKKLHGRDIYMYRGEKAFCSAECRSRQIMIEERKARCRSQVPKSADVSSSSYTTNSAFSTGIFAI